MSSLTVCWVPNCQQPPKYCSVVASFTFYVRNLPFYKSRSRASIRDGWSGPFSSWVHAESYKSVGACLTRVSHNRLSGRGVGSLPADGCSRPDACAGTLCKGCHPWPPPWQSCARCTGPSRSRASPCCKGQGFRVTSGAEWRLWRLISDGDWPRSGRFRPKKQATSSS